MPLASACSTDETVWVSYTIPYANTGGRSDNTMRFEIEIAEDRGAVLGSFKIKRYVVGGAANSSSIFMSREINGVRPF